METCVIEKLGKEKVHYKNWILKVMNIILISVISIYIGHKNYLLFHTLVELSSIIVASTILVIAFNTYGISKNSFLLYIGIGYGFVGGFDLLHTLSYKGMGILEGNTANLATQFWIIARYMQSLIILTSFFHISRKLKPEKIIIKFAIVFAVVIVSIMELNIFPDCFIEGQGLTPFKIVSEYIIIAILIISGFILIKNKGKISDVILKTLIYSIILTIFSELAFTLYDDVYGIQIKIGHILKTFSFITIYRGIIKTGLREPYRLLYSELDKANENIRQQKNVLEIKEVEIKEIEEQLLKNDEVIKMLVTLSDYSILVHIKGEVIFANENIAKLAEVNNPEELIGKNILEYVHPNYYELVKRRMDDTNEFIFNSPFETKIITSKGNELYIKSLEDTFIYRGKHARIVIIKDITESKKLLEVIEQDKLRTEAFTSISHDLKTPINVFFASLQLIELYLKNGEFEKDINKVHGHIKTMKQNSYRVIKLVNNLIDISKLGAGHMKLNLKKFNVVNVIEDISMSVHEYMENKGIIFTFDTEIEEKIMYIDPDKLERIMLNLLSNAIKFTSQGGSINVNIYDSDDGIKLSVKDTGTGIPTDKLVSIFDRFKQVEETLTKNTQGTGIGLSLVKSMIELHGGSIKVYSQWGIGSEFVIHLPSILSVDEDNVYIDNNNMEDSRVEKINIEFSDIYI